MKRFEIHVLLISLICFAVVSTIACQKKAKESSSKKGAVRVLTETGYQEVLRGHRGHILVVNFFTTWCEPCRRELPHFVDLSRSLKSRGVDFVGFSLDTSRKQVLETFLEKIKIPYQVYLAASSFRNRLNIQAVPTTYIYDRRGKRVLVLQGGVTKAYLLEKIRGIS